MNLSALEHVNSLQPTDQNPHSPEAMRKAAMQFEAVLLMQLTSALSNTGLSDDEDALFGGDSGTNLSKQMFSEQLANTMAQSGGVGLADLIMRQFGGAPARAEAASIKGLSKTVTALRDHEEKNFAKNSSPYIDRSAKIVPVDMSTFSGDPNDFEVVSTFEDEARSIGLEESQRHLILDGKVVNTTRARIVPETTPETDAPAAGGFHYPPNPVVRKAPPVLEAHTVKVPAASQVNSGSQANPVKAPGVLLASSMSVSKADAPEAPRGTPVSKVYGTEAPRSTPVSKDYGADGPGALHSVAYQMPVSGARLSSGFGSRFHPIDRKVKFHAGLDLAVPLNTPVKAAADGVIEFAGWNGGYGNLVIIRHPDGRETRYGHLNKIMVSEGEKVSAGQQFAISGSTGKSTGPHLHFEMRENGEVVNPLKIMSNVLPKRAER
jgi:murein DD-endopeptidase MepM/ murein hydrolase activator NlpD